MEHQLHYQKKSMDSFDFSDLFKLLDEMLEDMDQRSQAVTWHNVPMTRINTNYSQHIQGQSHQRDDKSCKRSDKRVTWNENLLEIRNISPRVSKARFNFPTAHSTNNCNHFIYGANQPSRTKDDTGPQWTKSNNYANQTGVVQNTSKLRCSPQLQAVVDRAKAIQGSPDQHENAGNAKQKQSQVKLSWI